MTPADFAAFNADWHARWPGIHPIAHELRDLAPANWVRFHSLPESQRYAETQAERNEIMSRHTTLLTELSTTVTNDNLYVITPTWSDTYAPADQSPDFPNSTHWKTLPADAHGWTHLHIATTNTRDPDLLTLLHRVANDAAPGIIITPPNAAFLYHPYDGGADVIAPDIRTRNNLIAAHHDWLPDTASGL